MKKTSLIVLTLASVCFLAQISTSSAAILLPAIGKARDTKVSKIEISHFDELKNQETRSTLELNPTSPEFVDENKNGILDAGDSLILKGRISALEEE